MRRLFAALVLLFLFPSLTAAATPIQLEPTCAPAYAAANNFYFFITLPVAGKVDFSSDGKSWTPVGTYYTAGKHLVGDYLGYNSPVVNSIDFWVRWTASPSVVTGPVTNYGGRCLTLPGTNTELRQPQATYAGIALIVVFLTTTFGFFIARRNT